MTRTIQECDRVRDGKIDHADLLKWAELGGTWTEECEGYYGESYQLENPFWWLPLVAIAIIVIAWLWSKK